MRNIWAKVDKSYLNTKDHIKLGACVVMWGLVFGEVSGYAMLQRWQTSPSALDIYRKQTNVVMINYKYTVTNTNTKRLVVMQCNGGGRSLCTGCSQGGGLGRSWRHHIPQQPHSPSPPSSSLPTFLNPSFPSWPSSVCCLLFVIDGVSPGGDTEASVNSATETVPSLVFWKPFALTSTHHAMTPRKL